MRIIIQSEALANTSIEMEATVDEIKELFTGIGVETQEAAAKEEPEAQWDAVLHDDNVNTIDSVVGILSSKLGMPTNEAYFATMAATVAGKVVVHSGSKESAEGAAEVLEHYGLKASTQKA